MATRTKEWGWTGHKLKADKVEEPASPVRYICISCLKGEQSKNKLCGPCLAKKKGTKS